MLDLVWLRLFDGLILVNITEYDWIFYLLGLIDGHWMYWNVQIVNVVGSEAVVAAVVVLEILYYYDGLHGVLTFVFVSVHVLYVPAILCILFIDRFISKIGTSLNQSKLTNTNKIQKMLYWSNKRNE